jgi:hypothetical protein
VLNHLLVRLRFAGWRSKHFASSLLASPAQFREVLRREQARTDRTGRAFSLVVFSARERETASATLQEIEKILARRLRCTDEIGWLDRRHIAVILPNTPAEGAAKVADDVCRSFPIESSPPLCEIHCYPLDRLQNEQALPSVGNGKGNGAVLTYVRTP